MCDYQYMVHVSCLTYNQASYIEDTLDGLCAQETTFPFVCTIVDDASTDGEQQIVKHYLNKWFDLDNKTIVRQEETNDYYLSYAQHKTNKNCYFVILLLKYNHHRINKSKISYLVEWNSRSKYYAICEGDDYWSDSLKLAKQVEILESDSKIGLCYAKAKVYDETKKSFLKEIKGSRAVTFEQQLLRNHIPTLTICLRNRLRDRYLSEKSEWEGMDKWKMGDYPMWLWFYLHGKVVFLDRIVAVYRVSPNTASRPTTVSAQIDFLNSTYEIKMHFAKLANVNNNVLSKLKKSYIKEMAYLHINNCEYQKGKAIIKNLPFLNRLPIILYLYRKKCLAI